MQQKKISKIHIDSVTEIGTTVRHGGDRCNRELVAIVRDSKRVEGMKEQVGSERESNGWVVQVSTRPVTHSQGGVCPVTDGTVSLSG